MTKEEFAALLNGREYLNEIPQGGEQLAKENGLLVLFGASEDLLEFRGTVDDECGAYGGQVAYLTRKGNIKGKPKPGRLKIVAEWQPQEREDPPFELISKHDKNGKLVELSFPPMPAPNPIIAIWRITTPEQDFAPFNIYEDGELYCIGCVVDFKPVV